MDYTITELINSARKCLELSGVKSGDKVVIWTDVKKDIEFNQAFFGAILSLDAEPLLILGTSTTKMNVPPPDIAMDALKQADMVLDLASASWLYTPAYASILNSGVPVLQVISSRDAIIDRIPIRETGENAKRISRFMKESKEIRITSDLGTDLKIIEPGRAWVHFVGYIERPDHIYDSLPVCGTFLYPKVGTSNGVVVVDGPITFPVYGVPEEPIKFTVKNGKIVKIDGGRDARNTEASLESLNDSNSYLLAHIGFGLDPRVRGASLNMVEAESKEGVINVAFGSSVLPLGGGDVTAKIHLDALLPDANMIVDDVLIIDKGKILYEKLE